MKNKGVQDRPLPQKRLEWPDVLRVIPGESTRAYLLEQFFGRGFDADSFGNKTIRAPREAMASALTATEDWLEVTYPRIDRSALRDLRRRLELELWP